MKHLLAFSWRLVFNELYFINRAKIQTFIFYYNYEKEWKVEGKGGEGRIKRKAEKESWERDEDR